MSQKSEQKEKAAASSVLMDALALQAACQSELCTICFTSELCEEPSVMIKCGHAYHTECLKQLLSHKWNTLRISFAYLQCPSCKQAIECEELQNELAPHLEFKHSVEAIAIKVARAQGLEKDERFTSTVSAFHQNLLGLAMHACSFYQCNGCKKAYFGGMIDCAVGMSLEETTTREDLLCKDCQLEAYGVGDAMCNQHGTKHIEWKCLFCCSVAVYFCYGTHYFCQRCHDEYESGPNRNQVELRDCGQQNCPLGVPHPPAHPDYKLSTFPLGCSLCNSYKNNSKKPGRPAKIIQEVCLEPIKYKAVPQNLYANPVQRQILEKERLDKDQRMREQKLHSIEEKVKARKAQAQRAKELRELQLQSMLLTVATNVGPSKRGRSANSDDDLLLEANEHRGAATPREAKDEPMVTNQQSQSRPMTARPMTAAEQRKQQLIAKRQAQAQRTQANLLKLHAEREAKIAALDAKLDKVGDAKTNAQRVKQLADKQRQQALRQVRPGTATAVVKHKISEKQPIMGI